MRILQLSTREAGGGAERVAMTLFHAYRQAGHLSWLAVGEKSSDDPDIKLIDNSTVRRESAWTRLLLDASQGLKPLHGRLKGAWRVSRLLEDVSEPRRFWGRWRGHEDFFQPASRRLLSLTPQPPDIIHAHNLHGGYFDLKTLATLSQKRTLFLTLHDEWLFTGHCAYTLGCERWRTGCGACPDLSIYPAIKRDATADNWQRKQAIYQNSRLHIITPSEWLMKRVEGSMLKDGMIEGRVIPNGVDLSIFQPAARDAIRQELGLPTDAQILLFVGAFFGKNPFKDYQTLRRAVEIIAQEPQERPVLFLGLGHAAPPEHLSEQVEIRYIPYLSDQHILAKYYQAADLFLHAAHADNLPNTISEALACGTPVISTATGGIPEQVQTGFNGVLVGQGDAEGMAKAIQALSPKIVLEMGGNARQTAEEKFDLKQQVHATLEWYAKTVEKIN